MRGRLLKVHGFSPDSTDQWTLRYVDSVFAADGPMLNYRSVTNRCFGSPPSTFLMGQLTSSVLEIVLDARKGGVRGYGDVIGRSH